MRTLYDEKTLQERVAQLGKTITSCYHDANIEGIVLLCVLKGGMVFAADLMRKLELDVHLDFVQLSSYENATQATRQPKWVQKPCIELGGKHVLVVDDVLDTGATLKKLLAYLNELQPASLRACVLADKEKIRIEALEFVGFKVPDVFLVGYGMNQGDRYRQLPFLGTTE